MFEKEAEEWRNSLNYEIDNDTFNNIVIPCIEFGYNKAKEGADKMKSRFLELCNLKDMRIAELEKANEWHYVKHRLPKELHDVLCFVIHNEHRFVLQGYLRDGRWVLSPLGTYLNNDDVIAWKEIVLPKEIEK